MGLRCRGDKPFGCWIPITYSGDVKSSLSLMVDQMKIDIEKVDRRNSLRIVEAPGEFSGREWAFVLPFKSVTISQRPLEMPGDPVLDVLSESYSDAFRYNADGTVSTPAEVTSGLVSYAGGVARSRMFRDGADTPVSPLTVCLDGRGEGMYHVSEDVWLWQKAWAAWREMDADDNRSEREGPEWFKAFIAEGAYLPITLRVDESRRLIKLAGKSPVPRGEFLPGVRFEGPGLYERSFGGDNRAGC